MRIIAGEWRRRGLVAPKGDATRPTADRTRETLFSMLLSRVGSFDGLRVADLFAGSGALGLEALSRGAASCLFIEQDRAAIDALRTNVKVLGADARADVRSGSVLQAGTPPHPFDLIMLDPPYGSGAGHVALDKLARLGWFPPACWISVETARDEVIAPTGFEINAERIVGKAKLTLLRPLAPAGGGA
ncbi:MAG: rRNA ((966)-N(2))-methyltransferase RsmD [Pseudomonadota bacterium]|jgi:16S rRNA (guanine966-N2)-methyltransferase